MGENRNYLMRSFSSFLVLVNIRSLVAIVQLLGDHLFCFVFVIVFFGGGGGGGLSQSKIFHSYGDVTMTGEGLQILTYLGTMAIDQ